LKEKFNTSKVFTIGGDFFSAMLYAGVVIIDMSEIDDFADYGGLLSKLKCIGIRDGKEYQIDNAGDLLMYYDAYEKCKIILNRFKAKAVNLSTA